MSRSLTFTASIALLAAALPAAPLVTTQLPRTVRPSHYELAIVPDAEHRTFTGTATITIAVLEPTDAITLNAVDLTFATVALAADPAGVSFAPPRVAVDASAQTATFTFERPVPTGTYHLAIDYAGKIGTQSVGLFALDYDTATGRKRALFTQFENSDARRLLPCWDEPVYRATFALEAVVPTGQMAVSNMPVVEQTDIDNGRTRVRFAETPAMSTYLLFFALGDLERLATRVDGTEVGVVTKKGATAQAQFALDSSATILREYNDYFATPFPLPKLDNVAAPGRSQFFGAMENWGAIFTFEYALLLDPTISTQADKRGIFTTAAHEISHQWFGDLVTMAWWDDLWLNEGFASWMESRTTAKLHPEWHTTLRAVLARQEAMRRDAMATTHPVVQHVETVEQASQAFDSITYSKGAAVIRMLEGYVGADAWRDGVRSYFRAHAYGNTVSDDLWREVQAAAGQPILDIAHDFTLQPGVPMIVVRDATCSAGDTRLTLAQSEYSEDHPERKPLTWRVPVIVQPIGGKEQVRTVVNGGEATLRVPGCGPLVINAGQSGYYRTVYTRKQLAGLVTRFGKLAAIDQLGVLLDNWSLGLAGVQPMSGFLDLVAATPADTDPQVWGELANVFVRIDEYYRGERARQAAFRAFAAARLEPVLARVGWNARPGEPDTVAILRGDLITALSALGDRAVIAEAERRYAATATDPASVPVPLRKTILGVVARHADAAAWDRLREAALAEKTPIVKDQLYLQLSSSEDEELARRALDLALTPEPGATNAGGMIGKVAELHPDLAFDYSIEHLAAVDERVDASSRTRYRARLATRSADPAMIDKLRAYASAYLAAGSRRETEAAAAEIAYRVEVRRLRLGAVDEWLARHRDPGPSVPKL